MRNCEPLRDFQKMCQVLLTISGGIMRSCESLRDFQKMCQVLLTISKNSLKFPYLLKNLKIDRPNQVWSIDITYIKMGRSHMYLTAIIDWYSRFIVGYELSDTLDTAPVLAAVTNAMEQYGNPEIINSDQGSQFTSNDYIEFLKAKNIRQSMDGKARWVDNVVIERWFRSLKTELIYINEYSNPRELRQQIGSYIKDYNNERPHQALGYQLPVRVYQAKSVCNAA